MDLGGENDLHRHSSHRGRHGNRLDPLPLLESAHQVLLVAASEATGARS